MITQIKKFFEQPEIESVLLAKLLGLFTKRLKSWRSKPSGEISEKQLAAYSSLKDLLQMGTHILDEPNSHQQFRSLEYTLRRKKDEFVFIFGGDNDVAAYLDEIHKNALDILLAWRRLYHSNKPATGQERDEHWRQIKKLGQWFSSQWQRGARKTFFKNLFQAA
ncbi:MAG TPA: hypothetical protein VHY30_08405 [Verrucomicrobiae bacterium]|jgi:hypothetical protein|nr:hypothetical protein [Verrucomicrobiae bacterium]